VTPRAFLLVCGIGLLQLAFIASYIGAFHRPTPHQIPLSVTAPAAAAAGRAAAQLRALPGDPVNATTVPDRATGLSRLRDRSSYGRDTGGGHEPGSGPGVNGVGDAAGEPGRPDAAGGGDLSPSPSPSPQG